MPGPDKSKVRKDFSLSKKSKLKLWQHTHPLPVCDNGNHDASCNISGAGPELACIKVLVNVSKDGKLKYAALCSHLTGPSYSGN